MTDALSGRTLQILGRFPIHLGLLRADKQFARAVGAIAFMLDELSTDLAKVRRAHRLGNADTIADLELLGAMHGIDGDDFGWLSLRQTVIGRAADQLAAAADGADDDRNTAAEALFDLLGIDGPEPRLALYAGGTNDFAAAARALVERARLPIGWAALRESLRTRIGTIARIHASGNGTIRAVLEGVANALDLDLDVDRNVAAHAALAAAGGAGPAGTELDGYLFHTADRFVHASFVRDRAALTRRVTTPLPDKLVVTAGPIIVVDLARQMNAEPAALLAKLAELGIDVTRADATLTVAQADQVATALGFELDLDGRGTIAMERTLTARDLGVQMGSGVGPVLARLAALGASGATADTELEPELVAQVARKFGFVVEQTLPKALGEDVIGIVENPERRFPPDPQPPIACHHGQVFSILRRGFGRELVRARITGEGSKTVGPMLVNIDEGKGIGFTGAVPDGASLTFREDGHAELDGTGVVTSLCFSFDGACFADRDAERPGRDFVFAGPGAEDAKIAHFVVTQPAGALDREATYPHDGLPVVPPGIEIGETRFAFFVAEASFGSRDPDGTVRAPTPRTHAGYFDHAVFAPAGPAPGEPPSPADRPEVAKLELSWMEHEAYAARILVPARFFRYAAEDEVRARVLAAAERFRPMGVALDVQPIDDRWLLGTGVLEAGAQEDPSLLLAGGTVLWASPAAQPV